MVEIIVAKSEYWGGMYVNGHCEWQNESTYYNLFDVLNEYRDIPILYRRVLIDTDWFENTGWCYLPDNVEDLVLGK